MFHILTRTTRACYNSYFSSDPNLQHVIIRADVFIAPILHPEATGDCTKLNKSQPLVQMTGVDIALNNSIELQHPETKILCNLKTVQHQLFTDMLSTASR